MTTVGNLADRCYRTYLEPPTARAAYVKLDGAIDENDTALSIDLDTFAIPEDELLMRAGVVLELGSELVEVLTYDEFTGDCTVDRGVEYTTAVPHADRLSVKLAPSYPRQSVIEALGDNILTLYPSLFGVGALDVTATAVGVAPMTDPLAVDVIEMWAGSNGTGPQMSGRIVDYHPTVGGRALVYDSSFGAAWVRYRRRFGSVTGESDTLEELGMDERWANIVIVGTCADLFVGADLKASQVEWVGSVLAAENIEVGTRTQLAVTMMRYRDQLLERAQSEMRSEYKTTMRFRSNRVVFR